MVCMMENKVKELKWHLAGCSHSGAMIQYEASDKKRDLHFGITQTRTPVGHSKEHPFGERSGHKYELTINFRNVNQEFFEKNNHYLICENMIEAKEYLQMRYEEIVNTPLIWDYEMDSRQIKWYPKVFHMDKSNSIDNMLIHKLKSEKKFTLVLYPNSFLPEFQETYEFDTLDEAQERVNYYYRKWMNE